MRDGDGAKRLRADPAPFWPYCYVREEDVVLDDLRMHGMWLGDGAPDGYIKIEASDSRQLKDYREAALHDTFETDVRYAARAMIDLGMGVELPEPEEILYFDIEVDDRGSFADPGTAADRVLSIAGVDGTGERMYFDDEDEWDLVGGFLNAAEEYMVLAGWNSLGYDFEYLENRLPRIGQGMGMEWYRWARRDVMPLYDMLAIPTKTRSLKLDDTGERELGEGKTGVRPGGGRLHRLWRDDPDELREYNMRDADLVRRIDQKFGLVRLHHSICDICGYPPEDSCYITKHGKVRFSTGSVVDAKILATARRKGIPQPNRGAHRKPGDFPGGYVLDPKPGLYDDVVVPDYSGMYPNIIRAFNFGRETWVPEGDYAMDDGEVVVTSGPWEGCRAIVGAHGAFVHPEDGQRSVPAEVADELVTMRDGAAPIVDRGAKTVSLTLYGVFASDFYRYFGPHSQNITLIGQELTSVVEDIATGSHPLIKDVVYGDTDSVMIAMDSPDDRVEAAREIASDIEAKMQAWAADRGALAEYLTLDVDDVYDRFYIGDKKKRYFGHRVWSGGEEKDDFKVRGFEMRKGDWPRPAREFQRELAEAVLAGGPTGPIVARTKRRLFDGDWDAEMASSTTLTKPIKDYKVATPHVTAAKMLQEEFGAEAAQVGDKVTYIKYGRDKGDVTWFRDGESGRDLRPRDYSYIWRKKFVAVMGAIGVEEYEQTSLGGFV